MDVNTRGDETKDDAVLEFLGRVSIAGFQACGNSSLIVGLGGHEPVADSIRPGGCHAENHNV